MPIRPTGCRAAMATTGVIGALVLVISCVPGPRDPTGLAHPPPDPLLRGPYLQAVSDSGAAIRWRLKETDRGVPAGTVSVRVADGAWRRVVAETIEGTDRRARLGHLPSNTRITYRLDIGGARIGDAGFRTAPEPGTGDSTIVLAFGDSGYGNQAQVALAGEMESHRWDLAVHVGDIAYDDGTEREFTRRHFAVYWTLLQRTPFYPVPGNHDLRTDGGAPYDRAFEWPNEDAGRYYRFRWGRTLLLALDTSTPDARRSLEDGRGAQFDWLQQQLRAATSGPEPAWTVVYMHHPVYSSAVGAGAHGGDRELRKNLVPLFERFGVDLVLQGHDHHYERTRPVRDGAGVPPGCGPIYLVIGGGGASRASRFVNPGVLTATASRAHHFLRLVILEDGIHGRAIGIEGETVDRFRASAFDPGAGTDRCRGAETLDEVERPGRRFAQP